VTSPIEEPGRLATPGGPQAQAPPQRPDFIEALRFWLLLGWISFGGPAGQIAIMHTELVERRRRVDEASFMRAPNFCMLLPGPEAMQLATFLPSFLFVSPPRRGSSALVDGPAPARCWRVSPRRWSG